MTFKRGDIVLATLPFYDWLGNRFFAILVIMKTNLNISLPRTLQRWVETQIDRGGYDTASDYFRKLLREEQKRQGRIHVEAKLQEALESGAPTTVNATTWRESDKRVQDRIKAAARKRRANGATH